MTDMREIRRQLEMTQIELADHLGVQQSTISKYERGDLPIDKRTQLALDALIAAKAAGTSASEAA
jgi:transcriptional regulator with XRE-family HTH domain